MAVITSKAIVLSSIRYGDTSLIVKCFTAQEGVKTYLIRGILKAKKGKLKVAYFQPLTQLQISYSRSLKSSLHSIKEATVIHNYETIHTSIVKQSIILFLSEILTNCIQEEEPNTGLYQYIESALIWLDTHSTTANFHLLFLLNLSKYLGFYPDLTDSNQKGFNLLEGSFTSAVNLKFSISGNELTAFTKLLAINFDSIADVSYSKYERQMVLKLIIKYFELHLSGFKEPKSLTVLETIFN